MSSQRSQWLNEEYIMYSPPNLKIVIIKVENEIWTGISNETSSSWLNNKYFKRFSYLSFDARNNAQGMLAHGKREKKTQRKCSHPRKPLHVNREIWLANYKGKPFHWPVVMSYTWSKCELWALSLAQFKLSRRKNYFAALPLNTNPSEGCTELETNWFGHDVVFCYTFRLSCLWIRASGKSQRRRAACCGKKFSKFRSLILCWIIFSKLLSSVRSHSLDFLSVFR